MQLFIGSAINGGGQKSMHLRGDVHRQISSLKVYPNSSSALMPTAEVGLTIRAGAA